MWVRLQKWKCSFVLVRYRGKGVSDHKNCGFDVYVVWDSLNEKVIVATFTPVLHKYAIDIYQNNKSKGVTGVTFWSCLIFCCRAKCSFILRM